MRLALVSLAAAVASVFAAPTVPRDFIDDITHLITGIDVVITLDSFTDNQVDLSFSVQNPLILPIKINSIQTTASLNGTQLASFKHDFSSFTTKALSSATSGTINNVPLTQGLEGSLPFVPDGILDISAILNLDIGILPIPIFPYFQAAVPTTYNFSLD